MTARLPVLLACHGGSPLSHATGEIAAELERRALVRRVSEGAFAAGDDLVVLDGCASACTARRLTAEGRPFRAALVLAEIGATADDVARRLEAGTSSVPASRPHRPAAAPTTAASHTEEDYLLALDALTAPVAACGSMLAGAPTLAAHVADRLGVTRPSAGEMLGRLERHGLVRRGPRKELLLTGNGRTAADRALRRQRLLEVFVVSVLGYSVAESWAHARALAASFDDDALERLGRALGGPERCPHGWPIDADRARAEDDGLATLDTLADGESAAVARLAENTASLAHLVELGFTPGTQVEASSGSYVVGGRRVSLDRGDRAAVLVAR